MEKFSRGGACEFGGKKILITTSSALDKQLFVVFWNSRTGCSDALITLSFEVKAAMKYLKSKIIHCGVLPHSPAMCFR